jgi:hypothetical protein
MRTTPSAGDFVVEYQDLSRERGPTRVVVVRLTREEGPQEVFSSCLPQSGTTAGRLAATWALEDGTCAWRVMHAPTGERCITRLTTDVTSAAHAPGRRGSTRAVAITIGRE